MRIESAKMPTEAIATATDLAIDNQNKFVALENALQEHDQNLFGFISSFLTRYVATRRLCYSPKYS
jgi:hypothetical protein